MVDGAVVAESLKWARVVVAVRGLGRDGDSCGQESGNGKNIEVHFGWALGGRFG